MKRFALVLPMMLVLNGCNTDGFEELQSVYSKNHKGETYVNTAPNTVPSTTPNTDTKPDFCKSLTPKTCKQIADSYPLPTTVNTPRNGCVEVQQQHQCFGDKDGDSDNILCDVEFNNTCLAVPKSN